MSALFCFPFFFRKNVLVFETFFSKRQWINEPADLAALVDAVVVVVIAAADVDDAYTVVIIAAFSVVAPIAAAAVAEKILKRDRK